MMMNQLWIQGHLEILQSKQAICRAVSRKTVADTQTQETLFLVEGISTLYTVGSSHAHAADNW
jgi:hypothetical protein